jgi:hypothetical protein
MKVDSYHESAHQTLEWFEMFSPQVPLRAIEAQFEAAIFTATQFSLEYILNPLGTYPKARKRLVTAISRMLLALLSQGQKKPRR